jgi:hypothetical protein
MRWRVAADSVRFVRIGVGIGSASARDILAPARSECLPDLSHFCIYPGKFGLIANEGSLKCRDLDHAADYNGDFPVRLQKPCELRAIVWTAKGAGRSTKDSGFGRISACFIIRARDTRIGASFGAVIPALA